MEKIVRAFWSSVKNNKNPENSEKEPLLCHLYVPHTTAGIMINEADDPTVAQDIVEFLNKLIPKKPPGVMYKHLEGNADAHIKAGIIGSSVTIPIVNGHLKLGRWQGIFFCEFDGPRERKVKVKIIKF